MSTLPAPARSPAAPSRDRLATAVNGLLVAAVGVLLGLQYVAPNKRVLQVLAAVVLFGVAWRLDLVMGIGVLVLALPFPRGTVFGNTNLALILLLLVIWMLRFSTGHAPRPERTPLDAPIVGLLIAYLLSFANVRAEHLGGALNNASLFIGTVLTYVLIVNNVRTTRDLKRAHGFALALFVVVMLVSLYELMFPGRPLVAGWIEFEHSVTEGAEVRNLRIGGPFFDFELLAEFTALNLLFVGFLMFQSASATRRALLSGVMALGVFVLFATVTRGAIVALAAALLYMGWKVRRRLRIVPLTIGVAGAIAAIMAVYSLVSQYTLAGDVISRFGETTFVGGIPDSRAGVWPVAIERWLRHPILGSGPYYASREGLLTWYWPHSLYLYVLNIVGVVGFAFFLWLLWVLWRATRPGTDDLGDANYAAAYLLIARVQLVLFLVDQVKIEYLRNPIYQFQIWLLFSLWIAARQIVERERPRPVPAAAP